MWILLLRTHFKAGAVLNTLCSECLKKPKQKSLTMPVWAFSLHSFKGMKRSGPVSDAIKYPHHALIQQKFLLHYPEFKRLNTNLNFYSRHCFLIILLICKDLILIRILLLLFCSLNNCSQTDHIRCKCNYRDHTLHGWISTCRSYCCIHESVRIQSRNY